MYDGYFVFDGVIHMFDNRQANTGAHGDEIASSIWNGVLRRQSPGAEGHPNFRHGSLDVEQAYRLMFEEANTDMAMAQAVPMFGWYKDGFAPAELNYRLSAAYPKQIVFCGTADPIYQGTHGALEEITRQVKDWGAVSFKFYQSQLNATGWRADDRQLAYPMYEKCLELGVKVVQFHKGLPFGRQLMEELRPYDLQRAALDFPDMTFIVHHLGDPYIDETISIAARFPNIWLSLSTWLNNYPTQPRLCIERLGKLLYAVGPDRVVYGSEAFIWPKSQAYIKLFAEVEMPEDLQDGYGYPALTREIKSKIFGENLARLMGVDIPSKKNELAALGSLRGANQA